MPPLRSEGARDAPRPLPQERPHRPDRDGRRLRRQGGVPVDHRGPRGPPGDEVGTTRQARVRPPRGHGGHHRSAIPPSSATALVSPRDGRHHGHGDRRAPRRGRLLHAQPRGALPGLPPCHRAPTAATTSASTAAWWRRTTPPSGAFRGFGAPQTVFAAEVQMDRLAEAIGMDPVRHPGAQRAPPGRHHGHRPEAGRGRERPRRPT